MKSFKECKSLSLTAATLLAGAGLWAVPAYANHPVLVEGNCLVPPAGSSQTVPAGTCGDYDGDGVIGAAEDTDGDRVFGTIGAALGVSGGTDATSVNQNGKVIIVTSGTFAEVVMITGNVTLEAAAGVEANIDAVLQGDAGSGARQGAPGIIVDAPRNRYVTIRNIESRNWTNGIEVRGESRVAISDCRIENNINYGILVSDRARVKIDKCEVHATGFRLNPDTGDFPSADFQPNPGDGIAFEDQSKGAVFRTEVSGSFGAGISKDTSSRVDLEDIYLFDNNPNIEREGRRPR